MKGIKQIKDYRLLKELGRGANGIVYEAVEDKSNKSVAIKAIPYDKLSNPRQMEQFKKELKTLYRLSHKNIIKIVGVEKTINNVYLILEFCNGGTLYDYNEFYKRTYKNRLPELIVQKIIRQVIEGLKFMHKNNIIHRDIKLENILINFDDQPNIYSENTLITKSSNDLYRLFSLENHNFTIKIADLGYARELEGGLGASTICGTPMTIAPEIVNRYTENGRDTKYNSAIDLWSFGAILYELLMGFSPFVGKTQEDIMRKIYSGMYEIPSNISLSIESIYLLNGLLQFFPQKRLSWDQIIFHPFITKDANKLKYIKLNSVINENQDESSNCGNMLQINSKDCSNFLWLLFKASGASLPFELDELDKDTYEEIIKDVIANQMFNDDNSNENAPNKINDHFEAAYIDNNNKFKQNNNNNNYNLVSELESVNKRFKDINAEYERNFNNVSAENVIKGNNDQQQMLNNESNFHLLKDINSSSNKEKEEEKIVNKEEENRPKKNIILEFNNNEADLDIKNKDDSHLSIIKNELIDQEKHLINENEEINKEEDKREKEIQVQKEINQENIKIEESANQEKLYEEARDSTSNQSNQEVDVSRQTYCDETLKKCLLMEKTIIINDLYSNPELKKNYINGSIDSQFSKESLNNEADESQSKNYSYLFQVLLLLFKVKMLIYR